MPHLARSAFEKFTNVDIPDRPWDEVEQELLEQLSSQEKCDVIYASWLDTLHRPDGEAHVRTRNLLVGQNGLSASFLAELAQNAEDARRLLGKARGGELLCAYDDGWLLVANNGIALSGMNMVGLCRFFVHHGGQEIGIEADEDGAIGKFGVGFKACHGIAEEVYVRSWSNEGLDCSFRLPICLHKTSDTRPHADTLERIWDTLGLETNRMPTVNLGHCTPEYLGAVDVADAPSALLEGLAGFSGEQPSGTAFLFRVVDKKRAQVEATFEKATHALFPIFLEHIDTLEIGGKKVTTIQHEQKALVDGASARRKTFRITEEGNSHSESFWILEGDEGITQAPWRFALPCDGNGKFISRPNDPDRFPTRGGYAFFPLEDATWKANGLLHVDLPTNLSRSNWSNDALGENAKELGEAIATKVIDWLTNQTANWHEDWQPADVLGEAPEKADSIGGHFFRKFKQLSETKLVFRSLWGTSCMGGNLRSVELDDLSTFRQAWETLGSREDFADIATTYPLILEGAGTRFHSVYNLGADQARDLFVEILEVADPLQDDDDYVDLIRTILLAVLGSDPETAGGLTRAGFVQGCLDRVKVQARGQGGRWTTLKAIASEQNGYANLRGEWHKVFATITTSFQQVDLGWRQAIYHGMRMDAFLNRLSQRAEQPTTWEAVIDATEDDWKRWGPRFWSDAWNLGANMPPVPNDHRRAKICRALRVPSGDDEFPTLQTIFFPRPNSGSCFCGVVAIWEAENEASVAVRDALREWGLLDEFEEHLHELIASELDTAVLEKRALGTVGDSEWLRDFDGLPPAWKVHVEAALKEARGLRAFLPTGLSPDAIYLVGEKDEWRRPVERWGDRYHFAPDWMTTDCAQTLGIENISGTPSATHQTAILEDLLQQFPNWRADNLMIDWLKLLPWKERIGGDALIRIDAHREVPLKNCLSFKPGGIFGSSVRSSIQPTEEFAVLPNALRMIDGVLARAINLEKAVYELSEPYSPISKDEVDPAILEELEPLFPKDCPIEFHYTRPIKVTWTRGETKLASLDAAFFAATRDDPLRIYVSKRVGAPAGDDCLKMIDQALRYTPENTELKEARDSLVTGQATETEIERVYASHREEIVNPIIKAQVKDPGYEPGHILRELIQNAESAYRSRPDYGGKRDFTASVKGQEFLVRHQGRRFNEPDSTGAERNDLERIVSEQLISQQSSQEVGRFNRGFWSIFLVTDTVKISSGGLDFRIRDLTLLLPDPQPDPAHANRPTEFRFAVRKKGDVRRILGIGAGNPVPKAIKSLELVFLQKIDEIGLKQDGSSWNWTISRKALEASNWERIWISHSDEASVFEVTEQSLPEGRVSVAIQVTEKGHPIPVAPEDRWLYLTLPTKTPRKRYPFLLNGDFEAEPGRLHVDGGKSNQYLIYKGIEALYERAEEVLLTKDIDLWCAWVNVCAFDGVRGSIADHLPNQRKAVNQLTQEFVSGLFQSIPHHGERKSLNQLSFPSEVLYLCKNAGLLDELSLDDSNWIDQSVRDTLRPLHELLPEAERPRTHELKAVVQRLLDRGDDNMAHNLLDQIGRATQIKKDAVTRDEIARASELLRDQASALPPIANRRTVEELSIWWQEEKKRAVDDYSLTGPIGKLLIRSGTDHPMQGVTDFHTLLSNTDSESHRDTWFRLLSLVCLLGAPYRRTSQLLDFWNNELVTDSFDLFADTLNNGFDSISKRLDDVLHREFVANDAAGENADYWRRVCYDIRKVHSLIANDDFHLTVSEALDDGEGFLQFLRSGNIPGQRNWRGVLGQSATSGLYFLGRELQRMGLLQSQERIFYACGPVRRAALALDLISPSDLNRYTFEGLSEVSRLLEESLQGFPDLLEFHDIPLLHAAKTAWFDSPRQK